MIIRFVRVFRSAESVKCELSTDDNVELLLGKKDFGEERLAAWAMIQKSKLLLLSSNLIF